MCKALRWCLAQYLVLPKLLLLIGSLVAVHGLYHQGRSLELKADWRGASKEL
jgi:hypothetical protein